MRQTKIFSITRFIWRIALCAIVFAGMCIQFALAQPAQLPRGITVVTDDNYPPYVFRDADGKVQGILPDIWALWSKKNGVDVRFEAMDWSKAQQALLDGRADVIDTIFHTPERARQYDFSQPYAKLDVPIFFHKSISGLTNAESLRGFAVGVKDGDASIEWLSTRGVTNLQKYPSYEAMILAAKNDEIRVFCMDAPPALYLLYRHNLEKEFRYTDPLYAGQFHWATRKGNAAMHHLVARGFKKISEAERKEIDSKWQGAALRARPEFEYLRYVSYALLVVLGVSALLILLNWALRRKVREQTSELSSALEALRTSERYNRMLFENTMLGLGLRKLDGTIVDVNQALADIVGYSIDEMLKMKADALTASEFGDVDRLQTQQLLETGYFGPFEKEYVHKSGRRIPVRLTGVRVDRNGEIYVLVSVEDVTAQKAAEARIRFLAYHDTLTSLPNRQHAQKRFDQARASADRNGRKVALLYVDLDSFKNINDSLGHATGDAMLKAVADRLQAVLGENDTISRQGGDEYLLVLPDLEDADAAAAKLIRVMNCLQEPFEIEGNELTTSASVGVAVYPDDGKDFDTLLKNADIAMYQAKDSGRNAYKFFDEAMHQEAFERLSLASRLRRALERRELMLHYQPFVDLDSGRVVGAEALLRWHHPEAGMIPPARFIPLAEDTGLIVPIGEWVLHEACRQAVAWHRAGHVDLQIAVNLSAVQFRRADFEQSVLKAIDGSGIDPTLLELEITESILITHTDSALATARRLKSLGVKLSIDDFGTGYSSLSYLKRFAVDKLKIDRSFVRDLTTDPDDAAIVRAIIQMARNLGLRTIAEGVEDAPTLERLRLFHCDEAQGYFFAKPLPAEQFSEYLARQSTAPTNNATR